MRLSQEIELAARAAQEVVPAVNEFAEAAGLLGPVRAFVDHLTRGIEHRLAVREAKVLMSAAAKIRATGVPPRAVSDKFLRAVLEDAPFEDDPTMQERWASLIANAFTAPTEPPPAFPAVLHDLSPREAALLDRIFDDVHSREGEQWDEAVIRLEPHAETVGLVGAEWTLAANNLARLRLIHEDLPARLGRIRGDFANGSLTSFGHEFVLACRPPTARGG